MHHSLTNLIPNLPDGSTHLVFNKVLAKLLKVFEGLEKMLEKLGDKFVGGLTGDAQKKGQVLVSEFEGCINQYHRLLKGQVHMLEN